MSDETQIETPEGIQNIDAESLANIVGVDPDLFEFAPEEKTEAEDNAEKKEPEGGCPDGQVWDEKLGKCVPEEKVEEEPKEEAETDNEEEQDNAGPRSEAERAMAHFKISKEEWDKMTEEEKKAKIAELPPRGSAKVETSENEEKKVDFAGAKGSWDEYEYIIIGPKGFQAIPKGTPYPMPKKTPVEKPKDEMEEKEELSEETGKVERKSKTEEKKEFSKGGKTFAEMLCNQ